ncbi:MAG TPA: spore coat protein U domain-containing protein [Lysobacter sp.]
MNAAYSGAGIRLGLLAVMAVMVCFTPVRAQTCTFSMSNVDFGNVDAFATEAVDLLAQATFTCTGASTPYIHACASIGSTRLMTGPGSVKLSYDLYIDSARTRPWGSLWEATANNVLTAEIPIASGSGSVTVPVYVRIFGGQSQLSAGAYSQGFLGAGYTGYNVIGYTSGTPPTCTTSSGPQNAFSFTTRATVISNCTVSATNIDFGQQGVIRAATTSTGVVTTTCTKGANYTIALNAGSGAGATFAERRMTRSGGSETLGYALYRDSGRTQVWGDGSGGSGTVSGSGSGAAQTATVYATLPMQTSPPPGSYADTITVTVTF